jgi:aminoglycoside 3-N-acetyltransferase I
MSKDERPDGTLLPRAVIVRRLGPTDAAIAQQMFAMMEAVFDERPSTGEPLDERYVQTLLESRQFWAVVAIDGADIVGGMTAHALPMTRDQSTELFIYDLAVRGDRQRRGIGRALVSELCALAAAVGIKVSFVAADDEDGHALEFYRALGGDGAPVTMFTFAGRSS